MATLVQKINSVLRDNYHIIIVDDSSPDGTGELAEELTLKYPVVVIHRTEKSRGTASLIGFKKALELGVDFLIEMDADFSHNPIDIPKLINRTMFCDISIGSRYLEGGHEEGRNVYRIFLSKFANFISHTITGLPITDCSSGFKCYSRHALEILSKADIISTGYSIGIETLYIAKKQEMTLAEVPIIFIDRKKGKSKLDMMTNLKFFLYIAT